MTVPVSPGVIPGVPRRDRAVTDRIGQIQDVQSEQRQALAGVARAADADGNQVAGPEFAGAGWGISKPRIHVPAYATAPYLSTPAAAGYTWTQFYSATFKPEAQQINLRVRWAVLEAIVANTAIGEFEWRWNLGLLPLGRGVAPTDSKLIDAWDSGSAGSKGTDGSQVRQTTWVVPDGSGNGPLVSYWDANYISVACWGHIRTATGTANDAAKAAPLGIYQSGIGQG